HLILQPIVENAIQHAIAPRAAPGRIEIASTRQERFLRLQVKDNGPGITSVHAADHHVGLSNVRARLEGLYGNDFSLDMTNGADQGLVVTVQLPFRSDGSA